MSAIHRPRSLGCRLGQGWGEGAPGEGRAEHRQLGPLVIVWALLVALSLGTLACGRCQGDDGEEDVLSDQSVELPEGVAELTLAYGRLIPQGTQFVFVARGFSEVAASFRSVKERIRPVFDLGAVEVEIRNTFGVDLNRRVTFREVGLAYDGGFALAYVDRAPVLVFFLVDPGAFMARARTVLRGQPFNLRLPLREVRVGDAVIHLFGKQANEPPRFAVMVKGGMGFLIDRTSPAADVEAVAHLLAETTPETSLFANPEFEPQVRRFDAFPGFLFIDTVRAAANLRERNSDQLSASADHSLEAVGQTVLSVAAGGRVEADHFAFQLYVSVTEERAQTSAGVDQPSGEDAHLDRLVLPSTYLAVRLAVDPIILFETILSFQGEGGPEIIHQALSGVSEDLGVDIEDEVMRALTGRMSVTLNGLSLWNLPAAQRFWDYADVFGTVAAFQVVDPAGARALLDRIVAANEGSYQRDEHDGYVSYRGTGEDALFGNLLLRDDMLIMVPDRIRRRLLEGGGETEVPSALRELMSAENANGLFISFETLAPLAAILNPPEAVSELLGFLDTLVVDLATSGNGVMVTGRLNLRSGE